MDGLTSERSALFLQKGMGEQPLFRGLHAFTGDMTKDDGTITPIYAFRGGRPVRIEETRADPAPVSVTLDASLQAIGDLVGSRLDCPIHLAMVADACLPADSMRSWGRWGASEPQVILLIPNAQIEQRTLASLMAREAGNSMPTGSVLIKFDNWSLIQGGNDVAIESVVSGTTLAGIASATEYDGPGACPVWYAAATNGALKRRAPDGAWSSVALTTPWLTNTGGICVHKRLIMVGGSDGNYGEYGVLRSTNGGATWSRVLFGSPPFPSSGLVRKIVRNNDDYFAFTSSGIWRSASGGQAWSLARAGSALSGAFDGTGLGVAVNQSKVFVSRDAGMRWTEVNAFGTDQKDAAFGGGYLHIVDATAGYARVDASVVRSGRAIEWTTKNTATGATGIVFVDAQIGYRLRGTAIDRTLNGGYSWETLALDDTASAFTQMVACGGRLGVIGGTYFGFYSPFFDQTE